MRKTITISKFIWIDGLAICRARGIYILATRALNMHVFAKQGSTETVR